MHKEIGKNSSNNQQRTISINTKVEKKKKTMTLQAMTLQPLSLQTMTPQTTTLQPKTTQMMMRGINFLAQPTITSLFLTKQKLQRLLGRTQSSG